MAKTKKGAGHDSNKLNPIGKGGVGAGADSAKGKKSKNLPPWLKKK